VIVSATLTWWWLNTPLVAQSLSRRRSTFSTLKNSARRACWYVVLMRKGLLQRNAARRAGIYHLGHDSQHHRRPGLNTVFGPGRGTSRHGKSHKSSRERQKHDRTAAHQRRSRRSGIPVVWGISATVERFNRAMEGAQHRSTLPNVVVDPVRVQESGLIKDTIILDIPDEVGDFDTVLVRRATDKLKESTTHGPSTPSNRKTRMSSFPDDPASAKHA